ncbi:MAG: homoserine O-succinyltransferase [Bacilli bacterium]|jgi:homoserine O-succinyltransferase|nr:homoserine O-succinyltransferase [Bacilli bacterium]
MPVIINKDLPASSYLKKHNVFVMNDIKAFHQDIRPLEIIILNLMPDKISTENQLLKKLSNNIIQINITLLAIKSHKPKNTSLKYLKTFYKSFEEIKHKKFDALIVTGAPIEHLDFNEVNYYDELKEILKWSIDNVFTSMFICYSAQFALNYFYDIKKDNFKQKLFGVFKHYKVKPNDQLFIGSDDIFEVCHSRLTQSNPDQIKRNSNLEILAYSKEAGIHLVKSKDNKQLFVFGHYEYDKDTLEKEYLRDINNEDVLKPLHYYLNEEETLINYNWVSNASTFYNNWLNYYVYQEVPYDL